MRISRHQMFMGIARTVARRSTCHRLNVGAVIVSPDYNVVSIGYNGVPSGEPHCSEAQSLVNRCSCIHAEDNAIRRGLPLEGLPVDRLMFSEGHRLYVTHSPCMTCAEKVLTYGIRWVAFEAFYRLTEPVKFLTMNRCEVYQLLPSDILRDYPTGRIFHE